MKRLSICLLVLWGVFLGHIVYALEVSTTDFLTVSAIVIGPPDGDNGNNTGGGGGGGGSSYSVPTSITFSGRAYPLSKVSLLKDGQLIMTTIAGPDSKFTMSINSNLSKGNYSFALFGEDSSLRKSTLFTFPIYITDNTATTISGIFITPTIAIDKTQVAKGDNLAIFGQSVPSSKIIISIHSPVEIFKNINSDHNGVYLLNFDTSPLDYGNHQTKSKASKEEELSEFSPTLGFKVGETNVLSKEKNCNISVDLNDDCKINLVDFSILAFWYKKTGFPKKVDLNKDGKINIVDFSVLAYYWTG